MNVDTSCNDFRRDNHESFCNTRGVFCRAMGVSTRTTFLFSILPTAQQHIWLQKCISSLEVEAFTRLKRSWRSAELSVVLGVVSEVIFVSGVILELTSGVASGVAAETEGTERREGSVSKTEARGRERRQE